MDKIEIKKIGIKRKYVKKNLTWADGKGWEGVVYKYTLKKPGDTKDGWVYIGCTPEEGVRRSKWNQKNNAYGGKKIAAARKQYGKDCFDYKVIETHYDQDIDKLVEKLESRESHYIQEYNSIENGFNGNSGGTGRKGIKESDEEIQRRNTTRKENGFHHTDEAKKKIGEKSRNRKKSDEEKQKISAANKGKKRTDEQRKAQSERMKGVEPKAATEGAKKWVEQNGGSYWKGKNLPEETRIKVVANNRARGTRVRAIEKETGEKREFETELDAAKHYGLNVGSVDYSVKHGNFCKKVKVKFESI